MKKVGIVKDIKVDREIEWKILYFSSLSEENSTAYYSPEFSLCNKSWCLKMYPNGRDMSSTGFVSLSLVKMSSGPPIKIKYSLGLKTLSGQKDSEQDIEYTFEKAKGGYGYPKLILRSALFERKADLLPSDVITLFCTLQLTASVETPVEKPEMILKYNALQDYKDLFLKKEDCDVIIKVKEQEFPVHKSILQARLPTFAAAMKYETKEKITRIIEIEDCEATHFSDFLYFLYCGEVENLTVDNVFSLFTTADKYIIPDLKSLCMDFIKQNISIDTFCNTIELALLHSEAELVKLCIDFFAKNMEEIMMTVKWQSYIVKNPLQCNEIILKALARHNHK